MLSIGAKIGDHERQWPLFCVILPNLAHCVKVVGKAIPMENLRLLCLVNNVCRVIA